MIATVPLPAHFLGVFGIGPDFSRVPALEGPGQAEATQAQSAGMEQPRTRPAQEQVDL
jgi:hypothetical protein